MSINQIIPQFVPIYQQLNGRVMEWGKRNLIAYATGCCINLSHESDGKLQRVCSFEVSSHLVTSLSFHPHNNVLAIGDDKGKVFLWDIDKRKIIASMKSNKSSDVCLHLYWHGDVLITLMKSRKLFGMAYTSGIINDSFRNFTILWDLILPHDFNKFSIDPHFGRFILFSGKLPVFSIYRFLSPEEKPTSYFETISLTHPVEIQDTQWSIHLPGYAYVVLGNEIMFFHIESRSLVPIISQRTSSSQFIFILQFSHIYSSFLAFHKNGSVSIYKENNYGDFKLNEEYLPKHNFGTIASSAVSPLTDNLVVFFYTGFGLALADQTLNRIVSVDPIFPSEFSSFDCNGTGFALGTKNGYVLIGNIFDWNETKRYYVNDEAVTFVNIDTSLSRVYWHTMNHLGVIDLIKKCVEQLPTKGLPVLKCFGSSNGALIVQRDDNLLGLFVDGKERPLLLNTAVKDISLDKAKSTASSGSFCVLLKNHEIHFYEYNSKNSLIQKIDAMKPRGIESEALCFAVDDSVFVTGFSDGILLFYDKNSKQSNKVQTNFSNLRKLRFGNRALFGLGQESTLFFSSKELIICPYGVTNYQLVTDSLILVQSIDGVLRFLTLPDWTPIHFISQFLPPPSEDILLTKFIKNNLNFEPDLKNYKYQYYSPEARDIWLCLSNTKSLTLQAKAGIGEPGLIEKVNCNLLEKIETSSLEIIKLKYTNLLFVNDFNTAAQLISTNEINNSDNFLNTLLSTCILALEKGTNEKTLVHLKSSAMNFLEKGKFDIAALLLRIGHLDKIAVNYLMEYGQYELALRFIQSCLNQEEKKPILFKFGCKMIQEDKLRESIPFFAGAEEYHPVLFSLFSLGLVVDAYFLMKYLLKFNLLKSLNEGQLRIFPEIESLDKLIELIEHQFNMLKKRFDI